MGERTEDETIWFVGVSVTEAYLQQALRDLHRVIENDDLVGYLQEELHTI